ncbi:thiamine pyrophosphate-dependent enzyme [Asticcacaulis solisilvae]|uniref:thiamine pyrophosphate-dependent enzyme n=1 Tax=Asticcacaulis solisilvae TaxID=1217274 RepID=UPI003FD8B908
MPNVCELLVRLLGEIGVQQVFGVPGDSINALTEAIRTQDKVRFVHVNHEESGAFAAVGQAKLTGRLGVCAGTSGPGAIHLLNALYDAKCDRAPVLAITGQISTSMMGSDYQQEVDLHALFKDVTVYNQVVTSPEHFPYVAVQAIQAAIEKRGVAHLNIPLDIATRTVSEADRWHVRVPELRVEPESGRDVAHAAKLINEAEKPVILAGIGCRGAECKVFKLAETIGAPIVHALRGKELFPESHPLSIGGIGNLGVKPALHAMDHADLLLMIGTNFPYVEFLPQHVKTVQIDLDPGAIGKRLPVDAGIAGDAGAVIDALLPRLNQKAGRGFLHDAQKHMETWRREMAKDAQKPSRPVHPGRLAYEVGQAAPSDAIFVCDTGLVTGWTARYLQIKAGQRFTVSGILATMAYSMGAAIGAKMAYPGRPVVALTGDGGFSMLMTDFSTAVKYKLPMLIVVFNNQTLGMIEMEQEGKGMPAYETHLHNPNFAAFAELCGGDGVRINDTADLPSAIERGLKSPVPFVLDVMIDPGVMFIPPRITLAQATHVAQAKIKEALG